MLGKPAGEGKEAIGGEQQAIGNKVKPEVFLRIACRLSPKAYRLPLHAKS
jgi:hypothetical protein